VVAQGSISGIIDRIVARVADVRGVRAIVLGGSRARGTADKHSDFDLGIYYDSRRPFRIPDLERAASELDDRHRRGLLTPFGAWGPGVNGGGWLVVESRHVDFLYRDLNLARQAIDDCRAGRPGSIYQLGHPLGFHNQIHAGEINVCRPLYDPAGAVRALKRAVAKYPPQLRRAIVTKHMFDAAFELSIADKPAKRGDTMYVAGCLFRAAGFMTLVVYALNRRWWLNEKGALAETRSFPLAPPRFQATIASVLGGVGREPRAMERSIARMKPIWVRLKECAAAEGIALSDIALS
jgi:predicted nucleotidyltransferase